MINDAHCHFFSGRFFEALAAQQDSAADGDPIVRVTTRLGWDAPGAAVDLADRWRRELDRHEVDRAALIASVPGDEASVATAVARHPDRFVGLVMIDPTSAGAEARAHHALSTPGLRGICLFPAMHLYAVHDPRAVALFDIAADHPGAVVFVHCGALSIGVRKRLGLPSPFDVRFGNPLDLHGVAGKRPGLPIIVPHFGAGLLREALMLVDLCPNVYLDTSSSNAWVRYCPGLTLRDVFRHALAVAGPDRLLFGTDSSFFPRGWQRGIWEEQRLILQEIADPVTIQKVLHTNFERLFGAGTARARGE